MLKHILFKKVYIFGPESPGTNSTLKAVKRTAQKQEQFYHLV